MLLPDGTVHPKLCSRVKNTLKPLTYGGRLYIWRATRTTTLSGEDYIDQIRRIVAKLGKPAPEELDFVTSERLVGSSSAYLSPPRRLMRQQRPNAYLGKKSQRQRKRALLGAKGIKRLTLSLLTYWSAC